MWQLRSVFFFHRWLWAMFGGLATAASGQPFHAPTHEFPRPVNTHSVPVMYQSKRTYQVGNVYADNQFDAARLNGFFALNDSTYTAFILPENTPINHSPWYAFRIWSDTLKTIELRIEYDGATHRYSPKISRDRLHWTAVHDTSITITGDRKEIRFRVTLSPEVVWVAGQEIEDSKDVADWCNALVARSPSARRGVAGQTYKGREIPVLDIYTGDPRGKEVVVILGRQHPPEVTGYLAMQQFIETILEESDFAAAFRSRYRVLCFPLVNPDGVDQGHWRHNAGGIDLNRDWGHYRQPETRAVADYIVNQVTLDSNRVLLGLDFHSTWEDIFYTNHDYAKTVIPTFKNTWLRGMERIIPNFRAHEDNAREDRPVAKNWFYRQFNADAVTYEVGDRTSRDIINLKGRCAALVMMEFLLERPR